MKNIKLTGGEILKFNYDQIIIVWWLQGINENMISKVCQSIIVNLMNFLK